MRINLKWNKLSFTLLVDLASDVATFKEQIYKLTNVPVVRQKLMAKGAWPGILKDDANLLSFGISDGLQVTLMGSADVIEKRDAEVKFVEDMTSEERALAGTELPSGLANLGNTCYMNAMVQCLRFVDGFSSMLTGSPVTIQLRQLIDELDRSSSAVYPYRFVQTLRNYFPQFAEMKQGRYMQQDADEFFCAIMSSVAQSQGLTSPQFLKSLGVQLEESLVCSETVDEAAVIRDETVFKLVCNINGGAGASTTVDHMTDGIKLGLEGSIEKYSPVLQRNSLWSRKQRLKSLPTVLCIQFMRFYWKASTDPREPGGGSKCKILRAVNFTETLDIFDFCTEKLQGELRAARHRLRGDCSETANAGGEQDLSELPPSFSGLYELCGVVTHQGRSADSGHYMSYAKNVKSGSWLKFDDDKVSESRLEDILRLNGGGDRDMAYFCFYKMKLN